MSAIVAFVTCIKSLFVSGCVTHFYGDANMLLFLPAAHFLRLQKNGAKTTICTFLLL
jgi:hypothetical protein